MKIASCTIIKDEHLFLDEWIQHNLNIGIDCIYLYEDIGSNSHQQICEKYKDKVVLIKLEQILEDELPLDEWQCGPNIQLFANNNWLDNYKDLYDWCAFIDVDEFIVTESEPLKQILSEFSDEKGITLSWKWYNASGKIHHDYVSVVKAFTKPVYTLELDNGWQYKSIVNLSAGGTSVRVHKCPGAVNVLHGNDPQKIYKRAWINHYFTKSWEDWCNRIFKRGSVVRNGHRHLMDFFIHNPEMLQIKDKLLGECEGLIPNGNGWFDNRKRVLCGGNTFTIRKLNKKIARN